MKNVGTVRNLSTTPLSEFSNRRGVPDPDRDISLAGRSLIAVTPIASDAAWRRGQIRRHRHEASYSFLIGIMFDFLWVKPNTDFKT